MSNKHFGDANAPCTAMANMFRSLKESGQLPQEMQEALRSHASNGISTIPANISSISAALAGMIGDVNGTDTEDASNIAYGVAGLADQLRGYQIILDYL